MLKRTLVALAAASLLSLAAFAAGDRNESLLNAASEGDVESVKKLLAEGADPNSANRYGATPLHLATNREHLEVVKLLIEDGADVNRKDTFYGFAPIAMAMFNENKDIAVYMIEHGLDDADSLVPMAVSSGSKPLVEALVKSGKLTEDGLSGALVAAQQAQKRFAEAEEDAEGREENLKTAGEVVALLEAAGAKPPPPSAFQLSPAQLARYAGTYLWPEQGLETVFAVDGESLTVSFAGRPAQTLDPTDATTFRPQGAPFAIAFQVEGERVTGFELRQPGGQTIQFVPKPAAEATAEAGTQASEKVAEAEPETVIPPGAVTHNWPAFRGPNAAGTANGNPPMEWDAEDGRNVLWKTAVPGRAHASPIVWGDHVFIATAVASDDEGEFPRGVGGDVANVEIKTDYSWRLYALDKASGKILWQRTAAEGRPRSAHHLIATQANATPVTDGRYVVAVMGSEGIFCYDVDGNLKWKKDLGTLHVGWFYDASYQWGHSSSPILYDDTVIVQVDRHGGAFIAAYALADGKEVWRTARDNMPSWGTPTLLEAGGKQEIVTNGTQHIRAYDPKTGQELWSLGPNSEVTVGTPVVGHGMVYVTGGYPPVRPIYAIRPGGRGDISVAEGETSNEHVVWMHDKGGTYMPSPLVYGDYLYTFSNNGVLTCYDAKTGERVYRERAAGRGGVGFTASPVAAGGRIYVVSDDGDAFVIRAGAKFERLAENKIGEIVMATPAISGDVLFVRSLEHVFAIGKPPAPEAAGASP